jgi:hypothetical protein
MKYEKDGRMYVQRIDLLALSVFSDVPEHVASRAREMLHECSLSTSTEACMFDHFFSEPEIVEWLRDQKWIVDFDQVKDYDYEKVCKSIECILKLTALFYHDGNCISHTLHRVFAYRLLSERCKGSLDF